MSCLKRKLKNFYTYQENSSTDQKDAPLNGAFIFNKKTKKGLAKTYKCDKIMVRKGELKMLDYLTKKHIESKVNEVRTNYDGRLDLPLDVVALVLKNGWKIVQVDEEIYHDKGFMVKNAMNKVIGINSNLTYEEKRFYIAVQFGHEVLGHTETAPSYVKKQNAWCLALKEEAEYFTRCLLIPESTVEAVADVSDRRNVIVDALVKTTKTPREQVELRLTETGLGRSRFDDR